MFVTVAITEQATRHQPCADVGMVRDERIQHSTAPAVHDNGNAGRKPATAPGDLVRLFEALAVPEAEWAAVLRLPRELAEPLTGVAA